MPQLETDKLIEQRDGILSALREIDSARLKIKEYGSSGATKLIKSRCAELSKELDDKCYKLEQAILYSYGDLE
jgi:hypothetical protein